MSYSLVAVDFLLPPVINATLCNVAQQLSTGVLRPLRHISHSMGSVAAAFRRMIQASHVGKVVVTAEGAGASLAPPGLQPRSYPAVAITGGSGAAAATELLLFGLPAGLPPSVCPSA